MFRYGFFAIGLCLLIMPAFSQSSSQIDGTSVLGLWTNPADPSDQFELRADGQFTAEQYGDHFEGRWGIQEKTLLLHLAPFAVAKIQWDGQRFITSQDRYVRGPLTSTASSQSAASASASTNATPAANQQKGDQRALFQKILLWERLNSELKMTKVTADKSDIVTPGSVLVLQKDGLLMYSIDTKVQPTSTYKNGKISMGFGTALGTSILLGQLQPGANTSNVPQRKFVAGEKFWVTAFDIQEGNVVLQFYSDPYENVRYQGQLTFPFPKHNMPPAKDMLRTIAEVITVQPDNNATESAAVQPQAPAPQTEQAMAPIPPPQLPANTPPPPPKKIALGQTKDQVVASFGQPQKVVELGTKEIYIYSDMKVTFVNGKVTDVQ